MKKLSLIFMGLMFITFSIIGTSCSSRTGKVGKIDSEDITYFKDHNTGLCFAIIGAKHGDDVFSESTSIGLTCVPCEQVESYLE